MVTLKQSNTEHSRHHKVLRVSGPSSSEQSSALREIPACGVLSPSVRCGGGGPLTLGEAVVVQVCKVELLVLKGHQSGVTGAFP